MARADLHRALVLDAEIHQASQVDASLLDPVVRVPTPVPGVSRPVTVLREYQGPQGGYLEQFVIRDRHGEALYTSPLRRIELRGEMFEDRYTDTVRELKVRDAEEHRATFYVDDVQAGEIPVFIEVGQGGDPYLAAEQTFEKALQKGSVVWLEVPQLGRRGRRTGTHRQAVWFVLDGGRVYVLAGPGEQQVPGLDRADTVDVVARSKDLRSRVSKVPATVRMVPTDDDRFEKVVRAALGKRLNLVDGDRAEDRWRERCTLYELEPHFRPADAQEIVRTTQAPDQPAAEMTEAEAEADKKDTPSEQEIHVDAEVDQEVFDQLIAEGKSERVARAKAKAAYVRREKARIRAEREEAGQPA